jgi:hypothetical protein
MFNTTSVHNDGDPEFYAAGRNSDCDVVRTPNYSVRITPALVDLLRGAPVDFTIHVKALRDFDAASPLVLRLARTLGRGTASFGEPESDVVGKAKVTKDGDQVVVTMKSTDQAARVIVKTVYPADWWAGFTRVRVDILENTSARFVEASVVVADRSPAAWHSMR